VRTIVAVCGRKQSGKDTIGKILIKRRGFKKYSFAAKLKEIALDLFDIDIPESHGAINEDERKVLQMLAHKMRDINEDVWIDFVLKQIVHSEPEDAKIVITDVRYPNELVRLRQFDGHIVLFRLKRKVDDDTHASEALLETIPDEKFDEVLENQDWSIEKFLDHANDLVEKYFPDERVKTL